MQETTVFLVILLAFTVWQTSAKGFKSVLFIWVLKSQPSNNDGKYYFSELHSLRKTTAWRGRKVVQQAGKNYSSCLQFFWQVIESSFTYLPLLSLLIVTEWRLWTCTSVLVTMMRAEWKLCNTSHFEYTEVTNVGGCPKVKTNITKFTVCDSSDERKKIQLAQVRNKVLPVQDQYRAFVPVYILKKVKCFFAEFFDQKTVFVSVCLLVMPRLLLLLINCQKDHRFWESVLMAIEVDLVDDYNCFWESGVMDCVQTL